MDITKAKPQFDPLGNCIGVVCEDQSWPLSHRWQADFLAQLQVEQGKTWEQWLAEFNQSSPVFVNSSQVQVIKGDTVLSSQYKAAILIDASDNAVNVTLPDATTCKGREYIVKKIDSIANTITLACYSTQTIDGATTKVISTQWSTMTVVSNGANWIITNKF